MEKIVYTCLWVISLLLCKNGHEEDCALPNLDYYRLLKKQDNGIVLLTRIFLETLWEDGFMGFE